MANSYKWTNNHLKSCVNDITVLKSIFKSQLKCKDENITVNYNCNPLTVLKQFIRKIKDDDIVIIHFSGHGDKIGITRSGKTFLVSTWVTNRNKNISSYDIDKTLEKIKPKCTILLMSDTCKSGRFLNYYQGKNDIYFFGSSTNDLPAKCYNTQSKTGLVALLWEIATESYNISVINCIKELIDLFEKILSLKKINNFCLKKNSYIK